MPKSKRQQDKVYATARAKVDAFAFDASVADAFDDMIRRSVPGYAMTLSLLGIIAQHYAKPSSNVYDLGCSLGAGIAAMGSQLDADSVRFIGIDNSAPMLANCRQNLGPVAERFDLSLECQDILETPIENASLVVLNFTLQFIEKSKRSELLERICSGLLPGGVLVLSEKILFDDAQIQKDLTALHHDFKRANGYSDLEISQKRSALENVLVPETIAEHEQRLDAAGFSRHEVWLQCFNFVSFLAFK